MLERLGLGSSTARITAFAPALEGRASDPLLVDVGADAALPWALRAALPGLARVWSGWPTALWRPGILTYTSTRHLVIDRALRETLAEPEIAGLLLVGAGFDTRAWRMADVLAGRPTWELDHPLTAADKRRVVAHLPPCRHRHVHPVDLARTELTEALTDAGVPQDAPVAVVWEGVSMYLHDDDVRRTLAVLGRSLAPGSTLWLDAYDRTAAAGLWRRVQPTEALLGAVGEPVRCAVSPDTLQDWLAQAGWQVESRWDAADLTRARGDGRPTWPGLYVVQARRGV